MRLTMMTVLGALALAGAAQEAPAQQKGVKVKVLVRSRIYYPKPFKDKKLYKKIGLVDCGTILNATPEYKEIERRDLDEESAEYHILVKRASDRFKKAVRRTVSSDGYDLIAESGAITVEGRKLPDITKTVIKQLSSST